MDLREEREWGGVTWSTINTFFKICQVDIYLCRIEDILLTSNFARKQINILSERLVIRSSVILSMIPKRLIRFQDVSFTKTLYPPCISRLAVYHAVEPSWMVFVSTMSTENKPSFYWRSSRKTPWPTIYGICSASASLMVVCYVN